MRKVLGRKRETVDLTEGSISKKLILFAFPMMIGNLLQQFYNIVDIPMAAGVSPTRRGFSTAWGNGGFLSVKRNEDGCKEKGFMVTFS